MYDCGYDFGATMVHGVCCEQKRIAHILALGFLAMLSVLSQIASASKSRLPVVVRTDLNYK